MQCAESLVLTAGQLRQSHDQSGEMKNNDHCASSCPFPSAAANSDEVEDEALVFASLRARTGHVSPAMWHCKRRRDMNPHAILAATATVLGMCWKLCGKNRRGWWPRKKPTAQKPGQAGPESDADVHRHARADECVWLSKVRWWCVVVCGHAKLECLASRVD